ncbi:MAG: hypothetical protein ACKVQU_35805 [Burkholderiales bacterium]
MLRIQRLFGIVAMAMACLYLVACGGGGGSDSAPAASTPTANNAAFPTATEDELPAGARVDVSALKLFPMGMADRWIYTDAALATPPGMEKTVARRVTNGPDAAGRLTLIETDGISTFPTTYVVSPQGLLLPEPLEGFAPHAAANVIGSIFEYVAPLYPQGAVRRHMRSGPWGADIDRDGIGESFRYEFIQIFAGFETMRFGALTIVNVSRFRNTMQMTIRFSSAGTADYTVTASEETLFAPGVGMVRATRTATDSTGTTIEPTHTLTFSFAIVGGVAWSTAPPPSPPPPIEGQVLDVPLVHNDLVYDPLRNRYYASIPASQGNTGNRIATLDPATGQLSHSSPIGPEPGALAIAADSSVLYAGLDGSGEVVKLALPSMAEIGRTQLSPTPSVVLWRAQSIAVSPANANVVAVSMVSNDANASHVGVALLRDLIMQPVRTQMLNISNLVTFDSTGASLYGLNTRTTEFGLRRIQVLANGLVEQAKIASNAGFNIRTLSFANSRLITGGGMFDAPALTHAGSVSGASDCSKPSSGNILLCLPIQNVQSGQGRILIADSTSFVIKAALTYAASEPSGPQRIVPGQPGQVALSYTVIFTVGATPKIRLVSSTQLPNPTPPSITWPVVGSTTSDGQAMDIALPHNAIVYDDVRDRYYASIPGSVIGAGNSIASIVPSTGLVNHSPPLGSEPAALALSEDRSMLYVGFDGSGEVVRFALPSMVEQGRTRLVSEPFFGQSRAETIAMSPADPTIAAVSMAWMAAFSPRHAGVALLRNSLMQPNRTQSHTGTNRVVFNTAGTNLYGSSPESSAFTLRRIQVLADGLVEQQVVTAPTAFGQRALSFSSNRVIAGQSLFDAPALTLAGSIANATDCWPTRAGAQLLCFTATPGRSVVGNASTFTAGSPLTYATSEANAPRELVQGPAGQIAISYGTQFNQTPSIRLFSSPLLP